MICVMEIKESRRRKGVLGPGERDNASLNRIIRESLIEQKFEGDEGSNCPSGCLPSRENSNTKPAGLFEWRVRVNHDVLRSLFFLLCGNGREQS